MWLEPKVILSNQADNKILAIFTKPAKKVGKNPGSVACKDQQLFEEEFWDKRPNRNKNRGGKTH